MNRKAMLASFQFANITEQMLSLYGVEQRSVGSLLAMVKVHLDVDGLGTVLRAVSALTSLRCA